MNLIRITFYIALILSPLTSLSQIRLPRLIGDGMVLQRDTEVKLWGWASPGEKVKLDFNNQTFNTGTDEKGKWQIKLPAQKVGGPYDLKFSASNEIKVENVVFGDVWVCSGQSNMELWMGRVQEKYLDVIAESKNFEDQTVYGS